MKKWIKIILVLIMAAYLGGCCWPYYSHHGYPEDHGGYGTMTGTGITTGNGIATGTEHLARIIHKATVQRYPKQAG
jgi:hypothetical protein